MNKKRTVTALAAITLTTGLVFVPLAAYASPVANSSGTQSSTTPSTGTGSTGDSGTGTGTGSTGDSGTGTTPGTGTGSGTGTTGGSGTGTGSTPSTGTGSTSSTGTGSTSSTGSTVPTDHASTPGRPHSSLGTVSSGHSYQQSSISGSSGLAETGSKNGPADIALAVCALASIVAGSFLAYKYRSRPAARHVKLVNDHS